MGYFENFRGSKTKLKNIFINSDKKNIYGNNQYLSLVKDIGIVKYEDRGENSGNKTSDSPENYKMVQKNDLVINPMNVTIGSVGVSPFDGCLSGVYMVLKPKIGINSKYYHYVFHDKGFQNFLRTISNGIMEIRESLNKIEFFQIKVPNPSIDIQNKVVSFLDRKTLEIDQLIFNINKKINLLEEYRLTQLNHFLTKGISNQTRYKNSGVDWIGEIPEHWNLIKLKYLYEIRKRISGELGHDVISVTQKGLKIKDLDDFNGQHSLDYSKYQLVMKNEFVMNHMDLLTGYVGLSNFNGVTSPDYRVFGRIKKSISNNYYLKIFEICYERKIFYGLGRGVSHMGRWRLPAIEFENFVLPLPEYKEQEKIVNHIEKIEHIIKEKILVEKNKINLLKEYKESLITEIITGKTNFL